MKVVVVICRCAYYGTLRRCLSALISLLFVFRFENLRSGHRWSYPQLGGWVGEHHLWFRLLDTTCVCEYRTQAVCSKQSWRLTYILRCLYSDSGVCKCQVKSGRWMVWEDDKRGITRRQAVS